MKKFILMIAIMFATIFSANAQIATENSKLLDNTYVSVEVGGATPIAKPSNMFPVNTLVGIQVGKQFTPVWGANVEGTAWFGSHVSDRAGVRFDNYGTGHNFFRGSYVGVNGTVNLSNLFAGYKGTPRLFEVSTVLGTGWTHIYAANANDKSSNGLGVKTGLDLAFNLGKTKAHTVSVRPAVLWDVTGAAGTMPLQFNRRFAEVNVGIAYTYHFKASNGTRHFKTYDVGAMLSEIDCLNAELAKKPTEVIREVVRVEKSVAPATAAVETVVTSDVYVFFAQNSAELTNTAKESLDKVTGTVCVTATASPEGTAEYNQTLSQRRADAVKAYLEGRGVTVEKAEGLGVQGDASGRVSVVTVK